MRKQSVRIGSLATIAVTMMVLLAGCGPQYVVFHPVGPVAQKELHLIILSAILVAIVIIPVLILLAVIVYRYRDKPDNQNKYQPDWSDSRVLEVIWWGIPIVIIGILGVVTTKATIGLTKPPETNVQPLTIDVTSLDWKWLFEYPGQNIATVNYAVIPVGVPVQFVLTADAPMNSFWVPQLGGQEYTMPGMAMRLWLQADKSGTFKGYGANFTGSGFAHMKFNVKATSEQAFQTWVNGIKQSHQPLTQAGYNQLAKPSIVGESHYSSYPPGLFNEVVNQNSGNNMKMGQPASGTNNTSNSSNSAN